MIFQNDKVFDVLKWIDLTLIPALIVFLGVVLPLFDFKYTEILLTILGAADVFLGSLIGISSKKYANTSTEDSESEKEE